MWYCLLEKNKSLCTCCVVLVLWAVFYRTSSGTTWPLRRSVWQLFLIEINALKLETNGKGFVTCNPMFWQPKSIWEHFYFVWSISCCLGICCWCCNSKFKLGLVFSLIGGPPMAVADGGSANQPWHNCIFVWRPACAAKGKHEYSCCYLKFKLIEIR